MKSKEELDERNRRSQETFRGKKKICETILGKIAGLIVGGRLPVDTRDQIVEVLTPDETEIFGIMLNRYRVLTRSEALTEVLEIINPR